MVLWLGVQVLVEALHRLHVLVAKEAALVQVHLRRRNKDPTGGIEAIKEGTAMKIQLESELKEAQL